MRPDRQRPVSRATAARSGILVFAAVVALVAMLGAAVPVFAKLFVEARLDAPISFQSPPGEVLLVGVTVTVPAELEAHRPFVASAVWLVLHGPRGDMTEARGSAGTGPGHVAFRIEVPEGGPRTLQVVLRDGGEEPAFLMEDPFTFRPIGEGTAQLVAGAAPAGPAEPLGPASVPVATAITPEPVVLATGLAGLAGLVAAAGLLLARSIRRSRQVEAPRQAPGA